MQKQDFKLDQAVTVNVKDGDKVTKKDGVIKGVSSDCNGNVTVQVQHLIPTTTDFNLEDVTLK